MKTDETKSFIEITIKKYAINSMKIQEKKISQLNKNKLFRYKSLTFSIIENIMQLIILKIEKFNCLHHSLC
jgi:hypothetical protein